ncbi:hypothetical protein HN695_04795 [Candidatus Woesearchaeota archaeon]|jgi:hypothetical protein|nr:hypothetical protein [Candidatus Woesearchaeota archaeon]MBT5272041.1 hypothetical protein [Candidatus Woesearchaeota archaeon]MBT6336834.1 hypothetical protein [Candidatus Woesearchaeota archaeon]MBT7927631.1 hypothetical protein [Candidatus Woesearchaeota archaeon]
MGIQDTMKGVNVDDVVALYKESYRKGYSPSVAGFVDKRMPDKIRISHQKENRTTTLIDRFIQGDRKYALKKYEYYALMGWEELQPLDNKRIEADVGDVVLLYKSEEEQIAGFLVGEGVGKVTISHEHPNYDGSTGYNPPRNGFTSKGDRTYRLTDYSHFAVLKRLQDIQVDPHSPPLPKKEPAPEPVSVVKIELIEDKPKSDFVEINLLKNINELKTPIDKDWFVEPPKERDEDHDDFKN